MSYYRVTSNGVEPSDKVEGNWLVLEEDKFSKATLLKMVDEFSLPKELFSARNAAEEVSRLEYLRDTRLNDPISLVLVDLKADTKRTIEERLEPVTIVKSNELLITHVCQGSSLIDHLLQREQNNIKNFEQVIAHLAYTTYNHFIAELANIKRTIDDLDQAARGKSGKDELVRLTDTQRKIVYIDQTLQDQRETLDELMKNETFLRKLADEKISYDIKLRQRHAEKMIGVYRDLLDSISDLFVSIMDRSLNNLMKYLDSAALIISIPSLFAGIWGMNVGGLPGTKSKLAFLLVMLISVLVSIVFGIYLRNKDYS
ncbi:magnesium transporter CorA family protein [Companilactobacillus kimchii]|uniref:Mg2 and co2 transporter n=2 Tax=Companilactobacillus kimchii TaxID=2801452 RepID=A0ABR5NT72_9LACO|nr:magnesium transporter CorA family protein [Companilactobacillus kimchii]KAE9562016.1 hypothetical protein ATN91_05340 [Companilactobacillus kimchii]KRK51377.1 mg2 and co2 transporter [Companilactobacillus kimchii DSM 13961 = JCM 10707]OWF34141.1 Magnesium transport protein CorA [Companilactobacillus kimchii]GEO46054.1 magnesium transporter [Companilactobacillus paralimentarius]